MASKLRTFVLCVSAVWLTGVALRAVPGTREGYRLPTAQKPTVDEIFETQNKQEQAGSPDAGRPIFEKLCAGCHRFGEAIGKDVGPDLTTIASRFKRRDVLESILWPSKVISDQYKSEMFEITGGAVLAGIVVREDASRVFLRTPESPERPVPIAKAQIVTR